MRYLLIKNPNEVYVRAVLELLKKRATRDMHFASVIDALRMGTDNPGLAGIVIADLAKMSPADRGKFLKGADAYELINNAVDLRKPAFVGDGAK